MNGIGTPTERMAEIAERQLEEYVIESPSYIRDTTDFLCKLEEINKQKMPDHALIFCFDVEKLYPSVPRKEGIEAVKW